MIRASFKIALSIAAASLVAGCGSINLQGRLDNRVACTAARDKAFVVSEYGPVGLASTIAKADADVICPRLQPATTAAPAATSASAK